MLPERSVSRREGAKRSANQFRGAAIITGYQFPWNITFYLDVNIAGVQLFYIRHASRQGQEIYLNPLPGAPQLMGVNRLKWGVQINQFSPRTLKSEFDQIYTRF